MCKHLFVCVLVVHQGAAGDEFYMVRSGELRCVVANERGDESECFRRLGHGDYFGEIAMLKNQKRAVSVHL